MTIASTQSKIQYVGNGSTATFAVPFMFLDTDDIEVTRVVNGVETRLTISTDYTLSGAGEQMGGVCTFATPPAINEHIVIRRNPSLVQEVDYLENDAFPASTHENALDKLTMICQTLSERLDRTVSFRVSSTVTGVEFPEPAPGEVLTWNDTGDNFVNKAPVSERDIMLPLAVAQGGTGAKNTADAQINLGFGSPARALASAVDTPSGLAALDAEPADTAILKADLPDLLQAAFGDQPQQHAGTDLSSLNVERNHILWTLTQDSLFSDVSLPFEGTYVFHIYPNGFNLTIAGTTTYKRSTTLPHPNPDAGELRITLEYFNGRKTLVSLLNMRA